MLPEETTLVDERPHLLVLLGRLLPPTVLLIATFFGGLPLLNNGQLISFIPIWLLLCMLALFGIVWQYYDWHNDHYIVTTRRVIWEEQRYIWSVRRQEIELRQIQNIAVKIGNPLQNLFQYGDIIIETAGAGAPIRFHGIPDPLGVQDKIFKARGLPHPEKPIQRQRRSFFYYFPIIPLVDSTEDSITWHRHWLIMLQKVWLPLSCLFVVVLLTMIGILDEAFRHLLEPWGVLATSVDLILLSLMLAWLVYGYIDWWKDNYVVTHSHIIYVVIRPLLSAERREAPLEQVQDARFTIPSFWHRLVRMGNVFVETAGKAQNFEFNQVYNPAEIQATIMKRLGEVRRARAEQEALQQREQIRSIFQEELANVLRGSGTTMGKTPAGSPASPPPPR